MDFYVRCRSPLRGVSLLAASSFESPFSCQITLQRITEKDCADRGHVVTYLSDVLGDSVVRVSVVSVFGESLIRPSVHPILSPGP